MGGRGEQDVILEHGRRLRKTYLVMAPPCTSRKNKDNQRNLDELLILEMSRLSLSSLSAFTETGSVPQAKKPGNNTKETQGRKWKIREITYFFWYAPLKKYDSLRTCE